MENPPHDLEVGFVFCVQRAVATSMGTTTTSCGLRRCLLCSLPGDL